MIETEKEIMSEIHVKNIMYRFASEVPCLLWKKEYNRIHAAAATCSCFLSFCHDLASCRSSRRRKKTLVSDMLSLQVKM